MDERRALVIGSQCHALPASRLPFLPGVAQDLAEVLTRQDLGGCKPALANGTSLLLDPTLDELDTAIEDAIARASTDEATLFLAFVGHGEHAEQDLYLLAANSPAQQPNLRTAFLLAQRLRELLRDHDRLDGLVLLLDACHAGLGAIQAARTWPETVVRAGGRFEILTATDHKEAYDGCFATTLVEVLRRGDRQQDQRLLCPQLKPLLQARCSTQIPVYLAFDGRAFTTVGDKGLWVGRNLARPRSSLAPLAGTSEWEQVEELTAWFQRTPSLDHLAETTRTARCVALVGGAGQGKSTLVAALARAELADDLLPARFTNALAFATLATNSDDLARTLAEQLAHTVDEFEQMATKFRRQTPDDQWAQLDAFHQRLFGPLRILPGDRVVRLVVDGLDQLPDQATSSVHAALARLASDPALPHVRLVVTARPDTPLPPATQQLELDRADDEHVEGYLHSRGVPEERIPAVVASAEGNWLIARLLADLIIDGAVPSERLPATLGAAYQQELHRAGLDDVEWRSQLCVILAVLAVAGVSPVLPLRVLRDASDRLGGPSRTARVRDVLVRLRGLVVRSNPGTPQERVGLFHATLVDYLLRDPELGIDPTAAHAALADALGQLDPMERLTAWFQQTPQLVQLVNATRTARSVVIVGPPGQGKSTLAVALARAELTETTIPPRFVNALVLVAPATTAGDLAHTLARQLRQTVTGFELASEEFRAHTTDSEWKRLGPFDREVLGPLRLLPSETVVRLVIDGLDQLPRQAVAPVQTALRTITTDPKLAHVRLVLTARPATPLPPNTQWFQLDRVGDEYLERYLHRRGVAQLAIPLLIRHAEGNWLIARVLADLAIDAALSADELPATLSDAYRQELARAGRANPDLWQHQLRPVVAILAVAGVGAVLPLPLLGAASAQLGGPDHSAQLRDVLVRLRGLVVRGNPGLPDEHVGLSHATLATYLLSDQQLEIDATTAHAALATAIAKLAPMNVHDPTNPLHRYAAAAEAEHLLGAGQPKQALISLRTRTSYVPAENVASWTIWAERFRDIFGPDHPDTVATRLEVARWTGQTGDFAEALRLGREVLADSLRILGPDHPDTVATRLEVARWTGQTGDFAEALRLGREVLADFLRILGPDHPDTVATRLEVARWTGQTGDFAEALRLGREVLADFLRILGPDHPDTVATRLEVARWTGQTGDFAEALRLGREVLPDSLRILGPDHPATLTTRSNLASYAGETGDFPEALRLYREVLADEVRVLGPDHPATLATRHQVAYYTGETGDFAEALRLYREVLTARERILGPDHPATLTTRSNLASYAGETGDLAEALRLYREVLTAREYILGSDHPDTLATRSNIAYYTGTTGDFAVALRLSREVLADEVRVLGPDHPATLATRHQVAYYTGETGDFAEALRLYREVLTARERILGPDHPATLTTRSNLAYYTGETGDFAEALRLYREVLTAREYILGSDHPDTLATSHQVAYYTSVVGDPTEALRLYREVLAARERILGPDHPDTLATRQLMVDVEDQFGDDGPSGRGPRHSD